MKNKLLKLSLGLMATGALTACGGGTNTGTITGSNTIIKGQFLDSAVSDLRYESLSSSGVTDATGNFQCLLSEEVNFYIGALKLGTSICQRIITPQTLAANVTVQSQPQTVTSASGVVSTVAGTSQVVVRPASPNDSSVVNRVRLLMTLDVDDNPANGIQLPSSIEQKKVTLTSINFKNNNVFDNAVGAIVQKMPSVSNKSVTDATTATNHFNKTLQGLPQVVVDVTTNTGATTPIQIGQYYDNSTGGFDENRLVKEHVELSVENNRQGAVDELENQREVLEDD